MSISEADSLIRRAALESATRDERRRAAVRLSAVVGFRVSPLLLAVVRMETAAA